MSLDTCTADFARLASQVGGIPCGSDPLVAVQNPLHLDNWAMNVVEVMLIGLAIACLVHAVRWRRTTGDATPLTVWITSVVCLLVLEPLTYFPQWFGLDHLLGLIYIYNDFSITFFFHRMPLFAYGMYPVFAYFSYMLVRRTTILESRNPFVGACCAALAFLFLFETLDTTAPQVSVWVWNNAIPTGQPSFGAVPVLNLLAFCLVMPFSLTYFVTITRRWSQRGGWGIVRSVLLVSIALWPVIFATCSISYLLKAIGMDQDSARVTNLVVIAAVVAGVAVPALLRDRRQGDPTPPTSGSRSRFALIEGSIWLAAVAVMAVKLVPDYLYALHAPDHRTAAGAPMMCAPLALTAYVGSIALLAVVYGRRRTATDAPEQRAPVESSAEITV